MQYSIRSLLLVTLLVALAVRFFPYRQESLSAGNLSQMKQVATLDRDIHGIRWSRDGRRVALLSWETAVEIRDSQSLALQATFGEGKKIIAFSFSPDPNIVAFCQNRSVAELFNLASGESVTLNSGNPQPHPVFSPDGKFLATGGYGTSVKLWDGVDGSLVREIDVDQTVGGLSPEFSPDGRLLAVSNRNSRVQIIETQTGKIVRTLPICGHGPKFSPNGEFLAVPSVSGNVVIFRVADGKLLYDQHANVKETFRVAWSPDGQLLATAGLEGTVTIWNSADLSVLRELDSPEWVIDVAFSPDGRNLWFAGGSTLPSASRRMYVWGVEPKLYSYFNRRSER